MVSLCSLVRHRGAAPLTATLRPGEIIGLLGAPKELLHLADLLLGRCRPHAGRVEQASAQRTLLLRHDDALPSGLDPRDALLFHAAAWRIAASDAAARVDAALLLAAVAPLIARVYVARPSLLLAPDPTLLAPSEAALLAFASAARSGETTILWNVTGNDARRALSDRVLEMTDAS